MENLTDGVSPASGSRMEMGAKCMPKDHFTGPSVSNARNLPLAGIFRSRIAVQAAILCVLFGLPAAAQNDKPAETKSSQQSAPQNDAATSEAKSPQGYSGMYTFLKEGEFVQVTVEDDGRVTGFVSRFDSDSDKGAFLDQFFKSARLEGNQLSFTTAVVRGISYDFKGTVERGEGKKAGEEGYFILLGKLIEHTTDANKKITSQAHDVAFRMFPEEAESGKQ
jgi:hypothetical protein